MVEILLATYNGEKYLSEQLDSIFLQDFSDFVITVRDDGSRDKTLEIIETYIDKYPNKIRLMDTKGSHNSPKNIFSELLKNASQNNYYCFCCQDDVWAKNKLSSQINIMRRFETMAGNRLQVT